MLGDSGASGTCIRTDQFSLTGRLHDFVTNPIPSPLVINNGFYKRDANGTQVDLYARNSKLLPTQPDPSLTAAAVNIPPVKMVPFGPAELGQYYTQGMVDPNGELPGPVSVINSADTPPSIFTKHVVDIVTASSVVYDYGTDTLSVIATSSDKGFGLQPPPMLSIDGYVETTLPNNNPDDPAEMVMEVSGLGTPPATITVLSSAGGSGKFTVTRNQIPALISPGPGVPLAIEDSAEAEADGVAVEIPVADNDIFNPDAPITSVQQVGTEIPVGSGTVSVNGTSIIYTPGSVIGDVTFQYTALNSVGESNAASVTVTVVPSAAGPSPIANPDGPVTVAVNQSVVIDVLANDSGNGGTLDPTSVILSNMTGGISATVDPNTGQVTYTADTTSGDFGFDYTVANTNGQTSQTSHVAVTIVDPEIILITSTQCKARSATEGEWRIRGTSSVADNNFIQLYLTPAFPADLNSNKLGDPVPVIAGIPDNTWDLQLKPGPACT
ncbi:MAG: Ig-like domain-containing protein [Gammaproteobacteria bacterium]